jgi:hypothetical protein
MFVRNPEYMQRPTLNERFIKFMSQLPMVEVIDELELPPNFEKEKRADFLIERRKVIVEIKSLESDPEYKVQDEMAKHQGREEYPLFYGELELSKILRHLPDGKEINQRLFYKISRSLENSFRKGNRQIGATKEILGCANAYGLLVFLNEELDILSPEVISYRVSELLTKRDSDGGLRYNHITSVWFILENYTLKLKQGGKLLPSIVVDGPNAVDHQDFSIILNELQVAWASFNNIPLVTGNVKNIRDLDFVTLSKLEEEHQQFLPRHEVWRKGYRTAPYLRSLSDEAVLEHGARLINLMAPNFMKGGTKIPFEQMAQHMEGWTHFLEESEFRGLDLKKMPIKKIP